MAYRNSAKNWRGWRPDKVHMGKSIWIRGCEQVGIQEGIMEEIKNNKENIARSYHRNGNNCSQSVAKAFAEYAVAAPAPRSDGGKCGAYLAGKAILEKERPEMTEEFTRAFLEKNGYLECRKLRGLFKNKCNDYVGDAAGLVEEMLSRDESGNR